MLVGNSMVHIPSAPHKHGFPELKEMYSCPTPNPMKHTEEVNNVTLHSFKFPKTL